MGAIFISYRRSDTSGHAGRLQDKLSQRFGSDRVFRDIDSLRPGVDFVEAVEQALADSSVVLALIGPHWLRHAEAAGGEVVDYPNLEVATALRQGVMVIPVLLQGALMPTAAELSDDLKRLARINAFELSDTRWDYDVDRLMATLAPLVEPPAAPEPPAPAPEPAPPEPPPPVYEAPAPVYEAPAPVPSPPAPAPFPPPVADLMLMAAKPPASGLGVTAFILGIVGVIAWLLPLIGLPVTIAALICALVARNRGNRSGMTKTALILAIIGLTLTLINAAIGAFIGATRALQG
jgi:hypothetical protein